MEKTPNPVWKNAMNFGAIGGMAMVLLRFLTTLANATFDPVSLVRMLLLIVLIVVGTKYLRDKHLDGEIKYSKVLFSGFLLSLFSGIILGFYVYLEIAQIKPELFQEYLIIQEEAFMKLTFLGEAQIEERIQELHDNTTVRSIATGEFFNNVLWGFIFSLIIAIFIKREKPLEDNVLTSEQ